MSGSNRGVTPWLQDADVTLYHGDVLQVLRELPAESVDCCVTSPPYWGLRDYGTGAWAGGDEECDHARPTTTYNQAFNERWGQGGGQLKQEKKSEGQYAQTCEKCGATRIDQQLGLEPTPEEYVERMVEVFQEVRRVLAAHGTVWLNLGDSYASSGKSTPQDLSERQDEYNNGRSHARWDLSVRAPTPQGLKAKDLVGVPWRVAFALQADGWYLRSDIIWAKPNPMPESVTDRPTKAHEYVFLLSKQPRYFFDQEAVREASAPWNSSVGFNANGQALRNIEGRIGSRADVEQTGRNIRSVWEIATQPYPEAHFATFPEELARRCIAAGTSEKGKCSECGAPWVREVERGESDYSRLKREQGHEWTDMDAAALDRGTITQRGEGGQTRNANGTVPSLRAAGVHTRGWRPTCSCGAGDVPEVLDDDVDAEPIHGALPHLRSHLGPVPAVVLDPFMGSGTVAHVARKLGRHAVGIDLNAEYLELAARRLQQQSLFAEAASGL